ncbi:hypothetical protein GCM10022281_21690 [Sphingomonas rosea]|uniref:O-antigen ligase-related domain-containing protein n=1 Tax=Sphingomonas rosea TaxID=335605 RepID=A0ABP7UCV4_9SPHN
MTLRKVQQAVVPAYLFLCLLLGGSTQGSWRLLILELLGAALVIWALVRPSGEGVDRNGRFLFWLAGAWVALVLIQLVPLPPAVWSALPGRAVVAEGFTLRGAPLPWLPLSLSPAATAAILPLILVPLGVMAGILVLGAYRRRWCVAALVAGTAISVLLGALQLVQGGPYLFPISNGGQAAGLFANSNHQATLLLIAIPFLAALIGRAQSPSRSSKGSARLSRIVIALGALAVVLLGLALNGSLAALGLAGPVALASVGLALPQARRSARWLGGFAMLLLLGAVAAMAAMSQVGGGNVSYTSRSDIYHQTVPAIVDYLPVGTGLGTFQRVYQLREDPAAVDAFFVNHAHSDPLEWALETGLPGILLMLVLLGWWAMTSLRLWRAEPRNLFALAGTIGSAAILGHSLVDYPLRDPAIQALFALCLVFMAEPRRLSARAASRKGEARAARHLVMTDDGLVSA